MSYHILITPDTRPVRQPDAGENTFDRYIAFDLGDDDGAKGAEAAEMMRQQWEAKQRG